jgi:glyoxylase-like metal-dependent hydrolase (beta-lactamase superfamily II)
MHLIFEQIRIGGDRNFGYLLGDRDAKVAAIIDPAYSPEAVVQRATDQGMKVTHVINTHGHQDHVNGNAVALKLTGAILAAHPDSAQNPQLKLEEGQELAIGGLKIKVFHTPGHIDDHIVLYEQNFQLLITGDLLFVGKVGGTGNDTDARVEFNSLKHLLKQVPDTATVWPGHDYGARPSSTIALEKHCNPFLLCADLHAFLRLKDDWPIYKKRYGLK